MKIRLIHGIHSQEGDNDMAHFWPYISKAVPGADVALFQYGFMGFWQARWRNDTVARMFAEVSNENRLDGEYEVWITHSNGAAIAYLAVEKHGAKPDLIINFSPALDRWRTAGVERVETLYSPSDRVVWLSQWVPWSIWGDQGRVGYKGDNLNTLSIDVSKVGKPMAYTSHNGAFDPKRIEHWAYYCGMRIFENAARALVLKLMKGES